MKAYDFRYQTKASKLFGELSSIIANICIPLFYSLIATGLTITFKLSEYLNMWVYVIIFSIAVVVSIVLTIRYFVNYKGVILYDDHLEISRYTRAAGNKRKMNIDISYSDIESVYNSKENLYSNRRLARNFLVPGGDLSDYIEITLKGGKKFLFSIENQQEFVDEIINKITDN